MNSGIASPDAPDRASTRDRLIEAVQQNPGASRQELAQLVGVSRTAIEHHVRALEAAGTLHTRRCGRRLGHFAEATTDREAMVLVLLRQPTAAALMERIADEPLLSLPRLARDLGVTEQTVRWHLARLRAEGIVTMDQSEPLVRAALAPSVHATLRRAEKSGSA